MSAFVSSLSRIIRLQLLSCSKGEVLQLESKRGAADTAPSHLPIPSMQCLPAAEVEKLYEHPSFSAGEGNTVTTVESWPSEFIQVASTGAVLKVCILYLQFCCQPIKISAQTGEGDYFTSICITK